MAVLNKDMLIEMEKLIDTVLVYPYRELDLLLLDHNNNIINNNFDRIDSL